MTRRPLVLVLLALAVAAAASPALAFRRDDLGARRTLPVLRVNGIDMDRRAVDAALAAGEITWSRLREIYPEEQLLKGGRTKQEFIIQTDVAEPGIVRQRLGEEQSAEHERLAWEAYRKALAGEDWDLLCKQYSTEPGTSNNGGDIGVVSFSNLVHPFNRAMFSAPVGVVQPPVQTVFGWHVGKVTEIIAPRDITRRDGSPGKAPETRHVKQILILWDLGKNADGLDADLRIEIPDMVKSITMEVLDPSACDEFPHWCGRAAIGTAAAAAAKPSPSEDGTCR